ncbi:hypothetical protein FHW00_001998 [Ochrobactrum sp. P6BSIII]|nr:hypothetical protein [Ochrobactrum sp. P6BSIII]
MSRSRFELTEWEWSIIAPLLSCKPRGVLGLTITWSSMAFCGVSAPGHDGRKYRSVTVLQRLATTGLFTGVVPVSGIGCLRLSRRLLTATS